MRGNPPGYFKKLEPYQLPNVRPYPRLLRWLLRWLQRRCDHAGLKADVLQADGGDLAVRWCETCGAYWVTCDGTPWGIPRLPDPYAEA